MKFRERLTSPYGQFIKWHYWGFIDGGGFISPKYSNPAYSDQSLGEIGKNGVELFVGDIVRCNPDKIKVKYHNANPESFREVLTTPVANVEKLSAHEIKWNNEYAGYEPFCLYDDDCGLYNHPEYFEKIGNKYENPELMESK